MKGKLLAAVLAASLVGVLPAHALMCDDTDTGFSLGYEFRFGPDFSEQDRNELDRLRLRREGVDATRVERWAGCLRAFVRTPDGGQEMQFFDPRSLRRLQ
jgi:hypothetical protein